MGAMPVVPPHSSRPPTAPGSAPRPPGPWRLLLEARAPWELAALAASERWLARGQRGDGHPVIVLPGLGGSDASTLPLRRFLRKRGWSPLGWGQGFNLGPREGVLDGCRDLLRRTVARHGRAASLVGWSLGGVYARELAKEMPALVRCVVTLGSPFAAGPHSTNAWRFYEWVSGHRADEAAAMVEALRQPPPLPTTSIYSRSDGIVAWPASLNPAGPLAENIALPASHLGMGFNPRVLSVIADRLAQDPARWMPYRGRGAATQPGEGG